MNDSFNPLPPQNTEAEQCLLGSMRLDREVIPVILSMVDEKSFNTEDHQIIFRVLVSLHEQGKAIDAVMVREELMKRRKLDEVGGTAYLGTLLSSVPSSAHAIHY